MTSPAPTATAQPKPTREGWLTAASDLLWDRVVAAGGTRPAIYRVSCGWPSKSALRRASAKSRRIGEAWHSGSDDGAREVFISPALDHPVAVMDVLLHEMIHAALPADAGHGPAFQKIMRAVKLEGKPTATVASPELAEELAELAKTLGEYPHKKLDADVRAKQKARLMKGECPDCGYVIRVTRTWIEVGMPMCPCGATMESTEYMVMGEPLKLEQAHLAYHTADGRFRLSTTKTGRQEGRWMVSEMFRPTGEDEHGLVASEPSDRWTYRHDRADALAFIEAVRKGETDFPEFNPDEEDEAELELDEEELDDVLGPVGDWYGDDSDHFLPDDEEETPDNPDGFIPAEEEETYEEQTARREAGGERTSQRIAAGKEGALD